MLSFSRLDDLCICVRVATRAASSLSGSLLYSLVRASIERLVYLLDGYKACFGSVLTKNCTYFTLFHVLGRNSK